MNEQLITICRAFAYAAARQRLSPDDALEFCVEFLPQVLAEVEILSRLQARWPQVVEPVVPAEPVEPQPKAAAPKKTRTRKKKARS
jgi:hypothetical protein